ncbi:MAG: hypothetical protein ACJ790_06050, partial [Myxococcaceae bacterium]
NNTQHDHHPINNLNIHDDLNIALLSAEERDLLRHVLVEEGSVEEWAERKGCSRATAYRHMAGLKALCRLEFSQRSNRTQLEALAALVGRL